MVVTYNHAHFIGDALDSIYAQSYRDFEVVVVDDGSTDATGEMMARWPEARYIYQQNRGLNGALNRGIEEARGEYIAILAADDTWTPDRLAREVPILDSRPEVGLVYADAMVVDEDGKPLVRFNKVYPPRPGEFSVALFSNYCFVPAQALLVRRSCFEHLGGFWGPTAISDYLKWIEIGLHYEVVYIDAILGHYRRHQRNLTRAFAGDFKFRSTLRGLEELLARYPEFAARLGARVEQRFASVYFRNGVHHLIHGEIAAARRLFGEALHRRPAYPAAIAGLAAALLAPHLSARAGRVLYDWRVPYR